MFTICKKKMSGYQVQNQNFAVTLSGEQTSKSAIAFLQDSFFSPSSSYEVTSGAGSPASIVTTGAPSSLLGGFIIFTGAGTPYTLSPGGNNFPTATALYETWVNSNLTQYGNQIYNIPATQRALYSTPGVGSNVKFNCWNHTAGAVTINLASDPNYVQFVGGVAAPNVIAIGDTAIFQLTVLNNSIPILAFDRLDN